MTLTATRGPFWEFFTILESRVEDVGWATPRVKASKEVEVWKARAGPFFFWGKIIEAREVIIQKNGMLKYKRPKFEVVSGRP